MERNRNTSFARESSFVECSAGAAIIEFVLVLPILLMLIAGCFELGRAILIHHAMTEAVRGGTRYLARVPDPTCRPVCAAGAERALAMTRAMIAENTRLAPGGIQVELVANPDPGTVAITAEVSLGAEMLAFLGLPRVVILWTTHRERRSAD